MASMDQEHLEAVATQAMQRQFDRVPRMREFHLGQWVERAYYLRYLTETALRIRLNNEVDAYTIFRLGAQDVVLGTKLCRYLADEYGHDYMFVRDLARFGFPAEKVDTTPLFPSTAKIMGYIRLATDLRGPAAGAVWNWFMEWHSEQYQQHIINCAAATFGDEHVRGLQSHVDLDGEENHSSFVLEMLNRAVSRFGSVDQAIEDLEVYINTFGDYFAELYLATVANDPADMRVVRSAV